MASDNKAKPPLKERLTHLLKEYGPIALTVYLVLFVCVFVGFLIAISSGFETDGSTTGTVGTAAAAWLATKVTQPLRIGATLLLTPLIGRLLKSKSGAAAENLVADDSSAARDEEE